MSDTEVRMTGVWGERPGAFATARETWARMKQVLFRGGRSGRWFSIGFCAWLASLTLGGGMSSLPRSFEQGLTDSLEKNGTAGLEQLQSEMAGMLDKVGQFLVTPVGLLCIGGGITLFLGLALAFLWLRARGEVMFVRRWFNPDETIRDGWRESGAAASSLFLWRLGFAFVNIAAWAGIVVLAVFALVIPFLNGGRVWRIEFLMPIALLVCAALLLAMVSGMILELLDDFVVPVMVAQGASASRAWLAAFSICNQHPFGVVGFYFVKGLYAFLFMLAIVLIIVCTLLVALIPLLLPYLSAVALLPMTYFFRGYSIAYLNRWRPDLVPGPVAQ